MIAIIIQARMSSTRLPGKVLKNLAGKEILWHVVERCKKSKLADKLIVATSEDDRDEIIKKFCKNNKIEVFSGSLNNVLKRFYDCAKNYNLTTIIRITSDCPLVDPNIIDNSIKCHLNNKKNYNYTSNCLNRTFPRGLDCEIFSFSALEDAYNNAKEPFEIEHVTPYIIKNNKTMTYTVDKEYEGNFRLVIDEEADYKLLTHIYDKFYKKSEIIDVRKIITYLKENMNITKINEKIEQKHSIN